MTTATTTDAARQKTQAIADDVTAHFIETGHDSTVAEIAARMGKSESWVRAALGTCGGCPDGCTMDQISRASHSRNYRQFESGVHLVWVYGPTREALAAKIREMAKCIQMLGAGSMNCEGAP